MAPILIPIGTAMGASAGSAAAVGAITVGTGIGAMGMYQQGQVAAQQAKSAQNMANYNAQVQEQEARARRQKATFDQTRQAKHGARVKSALTAKLAKAGGLGSPVALDLAAEQAEELELENLLIGYEGEVGARRAESQATLDRMSGKIARKRGKAAKTASYYQAGGTLLTGFGAAGMGGGTGSGYNQPLYRAH